jgi:hypothetical protein
VKIPFMGTLNKIFASDVFVLAWMDTCAVFVIRIM